nr:MAG TPA: syntaxin-1A [Caudoviricetes sp.]
MSSPRYRLSEKSEFLHKSSNHQNIMKKIIKYIIAAVAVVSVFVVLFALLGVGVFLLPLLGGAFTK